MAKILLYAHGSGETSHAYAISKQLLSKGHTIFFVVKKKDNLRFFPEKVPYSPIYFASDFASLKEIYNKLQPEFMIFCNSKCFRHEPEVANLSVSPFEKAISITVDSNWLFNPKDTEYIYLKWADKYIVNLTEGIFKKGLKENGGYFDIPQNVLEKIVPVGNIPSYPKIDTDITNEIRNELSLHKKQKVILCYYSGYGAVARSWVLTNLIRAVQKINIESPNSIKVVAIGSDIGLLRKYDWLTEIEPLGIENFYKTLSSVDLVFQHQGLATLAQAISAQIPTIANVSIYPLSSHPTLHQAEVLPFAKSGICELLYKNSSTEKIIYTIKSLLFDTAKIKKMKSNQKKNAENGEQKLYTILEKLLS